MMDEESEASTGELPPSQPWLRAIQDAEKAFEKYHDRCDNIEKEYARLDKLASTKADKSFQIFWANMEVLKPSVYQRPPNPVVMPRNSDTGPVVRLASEMIERALEFDVEYDDLHEKLVCVRDDLTLVGRGAIWVLDTGSAIYVHRKDFLHEPARNWSEVGWVARRSYLTKKQGVKRFGDIFKSVEAKEVGEGDYQSTDRKTCVWEVWDKVAQKVVWVTEGIDTVLDASEPMFNVKGFFPCPKPAYSTVEPGTLKPVPDFAYYRAQVDEINTLTRRIHSLSESLRLKGFYAGGSGEVGEAIETALAQSNDKAILVPVAALTTLSGQSVKDAIVWMPVAEVAATIRELIALRKQVIEDVYEITGLSDIMRGVTDATETLGAQNLKAEFGSVRVREKQQAMVRIALDVLRIKAEIFAENFDATEIVSMAGMQIPTMADIEQKVAEAQRAAAQAQAQGQEMQVPDFGDTVTLEMVAELLTNERLRSFAMEVETDSTISPNEDAEKQRRVEFLQAVGSFIGQAQGAIEAHPETAPFMAELLRFGVGGFRAGRDLGTAIDDFAELMTEKASQASNNPQPNPEQIKAQIEGQKMQADMQKSQMDMQIKQAELQLKGQELQLRQAEAASRAQAAQMQAQTRDYDSRANMAIKQMDLALKGRELGLKVEDQKLRAMQAEIQALLDVEELELEREQQRAVKLGDD